MDKWIKNNTATKLIALAVSVLLWGMVHMDNGGPTPPTTTYNTKKLEVKIQTYGFDDSKYALTGISADRVNLQVRGSKSTLTSIFAEEYKMKLDLSGVKQPGTHTLPLKYSLPRGVELVSMDPTMVTVTVEEQVSKVVPVSIGTKGTLDPDYRMGSTITADPNSVKVTLPESELARLYQVRATVDLEGAKENIVDKRVKLTAYDKEGKALEGAIIEPSTVAVEVPVEPAFVKVPLELEYTGRLPEGLVLSRVNPKVTEVKLYGKKEVLGGVKAYTGATINLGKVTNPGTTVLTADLTPPQGFERIEPSSVQVEVIAVSFGERMVSGIPVTLKGVPAGMEAVMVEPKNQTMSLLLTGAPDLLNSLQPADIGLTANMAGLRAGVHEIPLQVTLPRFINRADQKRLMVKVELKETEVPASGKPGGQTEPGGEEDKPPPAEDKPGTGSGGDDPGTEPEPPANGGGTDHGGTKSPPAIDGGGQ